MKFGGYSLIELILSLCLSSVIIALLMRSTLWIQRQSDDTLHQIQQVEEEAWMVSFFRSRFHQAGFTPCRHLNELSRVDTREPKENLQGAELKKRDHLILRHMSNIFSTGHVLGDGRTILVEGLSVNSDYPLMISDCRHAEVHEIAASNPEKKGSRVILKTPLFYRYDELFYVGEWVSESFFIKRQSLFYRHHHVDELAPWIDRMTVELTEVDGNTVMTLLIGEGLRPIKIYGRNL